MNSVIRDGERKGPFAADQLRILTLAGQLTYLDLVTRPGDDNNYLASEGRKRFHSPLGEQIVGRAVSHAANESPAFIERNKLLAQLGTMLNSALTVAKKAARAAGAIPTTAFAARFHGGAARPHLRAVFLRFAEGETHSRGT